LAYDTIKLKSPPLDRQLVNAIENRLIMRSGVDMASGETLYELFAGELLGSWDARISVVPKYQDFVVNAHGHPVLQNCEPYLLIEASVHKAFHGQNVYGGPIDFQAACSDFVCLVEKLLESQLPPARQWTVHRVDVALVYRLPKAACKEFFDGIQLLSFPKRRKGTAKYPMAFYSAGKTTTVKFYHKGSEFAVHDRSRLRGFFQAYFCEKHGEWRDVKGKRVWYPDYEENRRRTERKLDALQRLADGRLRAEVEIHSNKLQYDFEKHPTVEEVSDAYLQQVHDKEIEKLLREGKQGMDTVRDSRAVMGRLQQMYGAAAGSRLYGFWSALCTLGDEVSRQQYAKTVFYRNRKLLEDVGVSWRGTDIVVVANDSLVPVDFAPVRTDRRLCFVPARNRDEFQNRGEFRLVA
jgi:II/X family phage/plasmid replication protein